jgi:hypothetical protein
MISRIPIFFLLAFIASAQLPPQGLLCNGQPCPNPGYSSSGAALPNLTAVQADATGSAPANSAISNAAKLTPGGSVYLPKGTYKLDNSTGAFKLSGFTGSIYGAGRGQTIITCTTLTQPCLNLSSASNFSIHDLTLKFSPALTTRNGAFLLYVQGSSGGWISNVELTNGDSAGVVIENSTQIGLSNIYVHGMKANGILLSNSQQITVTNVIGSGNGDATVEATYYDSVSGSCNDVTITNIASSGDAGLIVDACHRVTISNAVVYHSKSAGLVIASDNSTTRTQWPDDVSVSNVEIVSPAAQGVYIWSGTTNTVLRTIKLFNLNIVSAGLDGVSVDDSNGKDVLFAVNMDGITVNGTGTTSVGFRMGGGTITGHNLIARNTGLYGAVVDAQFVYVHGFDILEPNTSNKDNRAIVITGTGNYWMDGITLNEDYRSTRSNVNDTSVSGKHFTWMDVTNVGAGWNFSTSNVDSTGKVGAP